MEENIKDQINEEKEENIIGIPVRELFASGHNACAGCGASITARLVLKAAGPETIVVNATGCLEVFSTPYPLTTWKLPWIHGAFENAAAIASGVEAALKSINKKYNVLVFGGDGGTYDIGFGALSGALERGHNFTYVCYENAGYMNTGIQRSGATPLYAETTTSPHGNKINGKMQLKKPLPLIVAAHNAKYVATANIALPQDLIKKVKKALSIEGPSYIDIFSPCPTGWYFPSNKTIEVAEKAYKTRVNLLYEIDHGKLRFTHDVAEPLPVEEYLKLQGRFKHLTQEQINEIQKIVNEQYKILKDIQDKDVTINMSFLEHKIKQY